MTVLVRGVRAFGGKVETLEVDEPRPLAADEVLIDVRSAGVGNWDDIIRTGGWDVGTRPPLALGVEAAGVIKAVGAGPSGFGVGDEVLCHPVPLRDQGTWAPFVIAPGGIARPQTARDFVGDRGDLSGAGVDRRAGGRRGVGPSGWRNVARSWARVESPAG